MKKLDLIHLIISSVLMLATIIFSIASIPSANASLLLCGTMCLLIDLEVDVLFKRIKNRLNDNENNEGENE